MHSLLKVADAGDVVNLLVIYLKPLQYSNSYEWERSGRNKIWANMMSLISIVSSSLLKGKGWCCLCHRHSFWWQKRTVWCQDFENKQASLCRSFIQHPIKDKMEKTPWGVEAPDHQFLIPDDVTGAVRCHLCWLFIVSVATTLRFCSYWLTTLTRRTGYELVLACWVYILRDNYCITVILPCIHFLQE